ncbi:class I SAM-dependent methyltransferase [bacterium]|nr:class I SAM-dependent methyltransferase [bacterium]
MESPRDRTLRLARRYAADGDPDGWFDEFYTRAGGDHRNVYWADLAPGPHLVAWLARHAAAPGGRAVVVGCGVGDDALALAAAGYAVTAFDVSPAAIALCRDRFPDAAVDWRVADLFALPADWSRAFDVVYECNTIQVLTGANRVRARRAIATLAAPGGAVLVSCRSRATDAGLDAWPLALDRPEIDGFQAEGLVAEEFDAYDDDQEPPVPHFFAVYRRPR